jgi:hypothetical protein
MTACSILETSLQVFKNATGSLGMEQRFVGDLMGMIAVKLEKNSLESRKKRENGDMILDKMLTCEDQ